MDPVDSVLVEGRGITDTNDEADGSPVSHNEETVDAVLAHYGKKGMKWGVRNDRGHEGEQVKTRKLDKLDKQWEKENTGQKAWLRAYNSAADKMNNGGIDKLNNEPEFKKAADDGILLDLEHPTTQKYFAAHEKAMSDAMVDSWAEIGMNPSGTKKFEIKEVESPDGNYRDVFLVDVKRDLKHAEAGAEPDTDFAFRLDRDRRGVVTKYVLIKGELKHGDTTEDYFAHYGVQGMKWGVSRKQDTSARLHRIADGNASRKDKVDTFMGKGDALGRGGVNALRPKVATRRADKLDQKIDKKLSGERGKIKRGATKANVALDAGHEAIKEGEQKLIFLPEKYRRDASSGTQMRMLGEAMALNRDARFKGQDLKRNPALKKQYFDELRVTALKTYKEELGEARTQAAVDALDAIISARQDSLSVRVPRDRVRHADDDSDFEVLMTLKFKFDSLGHVVAFSVDDAEGVDLVKHEDIDDFVGDFLQHYGVKGMKWGVRSKDGSASQPTEVTVTQKKPGTRVRTSGGKNLPPSDDAVRVATARQKAQSSSTDALSNKELGDLVKRMQLEQQYGQIMAVRNQSVISKGYKAVKGLLGVADTANRAYNLQNTPLAQQLREELDKEK